MKTCGKVLKDGKRLFGSATLSCVWPDDGLFYNAVALDLQSISLKTVASHYTFTAIGDYCAIRYLDDGTTQLLPVECILIKKRAYCLSSTQKWAMAVSMS
jgi:hypothetical protein